MVLEVLEYLLDMVGVVPLSHGNCQAQKLEPTEHRNQDRNLIFNHTSVYIAKIKICCKHAHNN